MKAIDRILQDWRFEKIRPYLRRKAKILDIGCSDGALFRHFRRLSVGGVGIDPYMESIDSTEGCILLKGRFPQALENVFYADRPPFDIVALLAVLEHMNDAEIRQLASNLRSFIGRDCKVIVTIPQPLVDSILSMLVKLRLIDGMDIDSHHGIKPDDVICAFKDNGYVMTIKRKFQLRLNNLFVFEKGPEDTNE